MNYWSSGGLFIKKSIPRIRFTLLFLVLGMLAFSVICYSKPRNTDLLVFEYVDPLQKVFPENTYFKPQKAVAEVARGEYASFQFVVRTALPVKQLKVSVETEKGATGELCPASVRLVGYVQVSRSSNDPSPDRLISNSGWYPDPLMEIIPPELSPCVSRSLWVTIPIGTNVQPGIYKGALTIAGKILGKSFSEKREFAVHVHHPIITKTSLWVTNWINLGYLKFMNGGKAPAQYSDRYWELIRSLAHTMKEYRQNVSLVSPVSFCNFTMKDGKWNYDFSNFNRMVRILTEEGIAGRIEGGHIAGSPDGFGGPFNVRVPVWKGDNSLSFEYMEISKPEAREFLSNFFQALLKDLRENGWDKIYLQHIADEPGDKNYQSYADIATYVKRVAPDFKIIEACHSHNLNNTIDVWVPMLNCLNDDFDFYAARQKEGAELWFYTCIKPQGRYANRFIELPLIKTRLLHWINYRYNVTGYLHWGLNYWIKDPYVDASDIDYDGGSVLPGGDCWIVYPADGKVLASIRLEAMRDGIFDYELLKMLEEKHPEDAAKLAKEIICKFDRYDTSITNFRERRRKIFELLDQ